MRVGVACLGKLEKLENLGNLGKLGKLVILCHIPKLIKLLKLSKLPTPVTAVTGVHPPVTLLHCYKILEGALVIVNRELDDGWLYCGIDSNNRLCYG